MPRRRKPDFDAILAELDAESLTKRPRWGLWILIGLGALALFGGGTVAAVKISSESERKKLAAVLPFLRAAAEDNGLRVSWMAAIAKQESRFDPGATNNTGGDAARGGAFGLMQMTLKTAQGLGFDLTPEELQEPETNAQVAATLLAQLVKQFGDNFADVAAAYNSGKPFARAPEVTRTKYVPPVLQYQKDFLGLDSGADVA